MKLEIATAGVGADETAFLPAVASAKGGSSRSGRPSPEPVGTFEKDESPYGVRDMAGSMRTWCEDWYDEKGDQTCVRGGAWSFTNVSVFRSASRLGAARTFVNPLVGFRLARRPSPR